MTFRRKVDFLDMPTTQYRYACRFRRETRGFLCLTLFSRNNRNWNRRKPAKLDLSGHFEGRHSVRPKDFLAATNGSAEPSNEHDTSHGAKTAGGAGRILAITGR